jgi:hypothetical protein
MISSPPRHPETESLTIKIAQKVAERKGVDPTELQPPLYTVVNTEALNKLFESTKDGPRSGTVTFEYNGYSVQAEADGTVEVEPRDISC